ncbi:MAG: ABC transporter permease [Burkholderiales bacterium]|jgi:NitT/TauT family transport system permease protein|nr:ABC transporter permease [Burkholderiales bacterium]
MEKILYLRLRHYFVATITFAIFFALWFWASRNYGNLILPSPLETSSRLIEMLQTQNVRDALLDSGRRAFSGFALALFTGTLLGILAGLSQFMRSALSPLVIICMGIPPIAWIVLALIWFGLGDGTPIFTVCISTFPLLFTNALAGMTTQDPQLRDMYRVFKLSRWQVLCDVVLPHLVAYIFPGAMIALASAWKVTIMAELLSTSGGLGDQLAVSRNTLDVAGTLALVTIMTSILLIFQFFILEPTRRRIERWR